MIDIRATLTRHTRESGYPDRCGFAILSLALWNTWAAGQAGR